MAGEFSAPQPAAMLCHRPRFAAALALTACLLIAPVLAGCGGGGGSGSPGATITTPVVTAPAGPTPIAPIAQSAADFSYDRSFTALGATEIGTSDERTLNSAVTLDAERSTIGLDFSAATRTYRPRYDAEGAQFRTSLIAQQPGLAADADRYVDERTLFTRSNGLRNLGTLPVLDWVGYSYWAIDISAAGDGSQVRKRRMIFGMPTVPSAIPTSGTAVFSFDSDYPVEQTEPATGLLLGRVGQLNVDWSAGTINGVLLIVRQIPGIIHVVTTTVYVSGQVDRATGRITGTRSATVGNGSGEMRIVGQLYGPNATEVGIVMAAVRPDNMGFTGVLLGKRPS